MLKGSRSRSNSGVSVGAVDVGVVRAVGALVRVGVTPVGVGVGLVGTGIVTEMGVEGVEALGLGVRVV